MARRTGRFRDGRASQTALSTGRHPSGNARDGPTDGATRSLPEPDQARVPFVAQTGTARDAVILVFAHLVRFIRIATARPRGAAPDAARRAGTADRAAFFLLERHVVEVARWRGSRCAGREMAWSAALSDRSHAFETGET